MTRTPVHTPHAPQAIGTYSQAIRAGDTVYLSGQIPLDPATGELVAGDMEAQVRQVYLRLEHAQAACCRSRGGGVLVGGWVGGWGFSDRRRGSRHTHHTHHTHTATTPSIHRPCPPKRT